MIHNCLIVDDDPLAGLVLEKHISKVSNLRLLNKYECPLEALGVLEQEQVDLLFLDIEMPEISGIEFLSIMRGAPKVILTTSYPDYAIKAFEIGVLDYLLKPVCFHRFMKSINKFYRSLDPELMRVADSEADFFIEVRNNKRKIKIKLSDIEYIESIQESVFIHTLKNIIETKRRIGIFEKQLQDMQFIRIHRSYIISCVKVKAFSHTKVRMQNACLPIGQRYRKQVLEMFALD